MAHALDRSGRGITEINVTPLVDVVLVLLVVMMVTASYIASQSLPLDLPKAATAEAVSAPLTIGLTRDGGLFLDGEAIDETALREKMRSARRASSELRAVIAADGAVPHSRVVSIIDLLRREQIVRFAINVDPHDLVAPAR